MNNHSPHNHGAAAAAAALLAVAQLLPFRRILVCASSDLPRLWPACRGRVQNMGREREHKRRRGKKGKRGDITKREWILQKKERRRKQGKDVQSNSKYTVRPTAPSKITLD